MARIHKIDKSRVEHKCSRCGVTIKKGEPYFYAEPRYGGRVIGCILHRPRPSQLTSSDKLATLYGTQEALEDIINPDHDDREQIETYLNDLDSQLETSAEEVRDVGEQYEESASNMEEYFTSGSSQIDEIREKSEACESWADDLEDAKSGVEDLINELENLAEVEEPQDDPAVFETKEDYEGALTDYNSYMDELDRIATDAEERLSDALGNFSL